MTITVGGSSITFPDSTTQTTAGGAGTVTSVATGNGLSGGTITTSGTLVVACPSFNSVGSYAFVQIVNTGISLGSGTNYAAGSTGVQSFLFYFPCSISYVVVNNLSGTWKWMGASNGAISQPIGIACRVA